MKWLIVILILAIVLIAGCTQMQSAYAPAQQSPQQIPSHLESTNEINFTNVSMKNETIDIYKDKINLSFKDNITGCYLNGEVFLNNVSVENTSSGKIILNKSLFSQNVNDVYIDGRLDYCFGNYSDWVYDTGHWTINSYDIVSKSNFLLVDNIKPREGGGKLALNYITPDAVKGVIASKNLDGIWNYFLNGFVWENPIEQFGEYRWQLPTEFLKNKKGDCIDWSVAFVSLVLSNNDSIPCFVAEILLNESEGYSGHAGSLCINGNDIYIYDQWYTRKAWVKEGIETQLEQWCKGIEVYGRINNMKSCTFFEVFNNKFYKTFNSNKEFADWLKLNYFKS
jgi:hypothetical protein